jgi:hypothetical protein
MADLNGFDANEVDPRVAYEALPAGKYTAVITASETKQTKSGGGQYLHLTFEVIEGDHKGRKFFVRLNLVNTNAQAVQIARAELSSICRAAGVMQPKDSCELHNLPMLVNLRTRKRNDADELENLVTKYERKEAATSQPQQAASGAAPWRR